MPVMRMQQQKALTTVTNVSWVHASNYGPVTSEKAKLTNLNVQKVIFSKATVSLKVHCVQDSLLLQINL